MVLTAFLLCLLLAVLSSLLVKSWKRSDIPGPIGFPFFGQSLDLVGISSKDILPTFKKWVDIYGGIYKLEIVGMIYVILSEPETVESLLSSTTNIIKGHFEYSFIRLWLNRGLISSDGERWRVRRKLLTPSFHFKILESSLAGIFRHSEAYATALLASGGKSIEIQKMIRSTALNVICETAMGVKLNPKDIRQTEFISAINQVTDSIVQRFLKFWLFPDFIYRRSKLGKSFFKTTETLHKFAQEVILEKKTSLQSEKTLSQDEKNMKKYQKKAFLDTLLELDNLNPGLFSEDDIREEVDTFMFAGHDTVSAALIFSHFLIASHPNVQEKAYNEQKEIFGDDKRMPTTQDLHKMKYLEMVIKETLRLYPSVPYHSRTLTEDLKVGDKIIRAGQTAVILTHYVHRSKKHWVDPEEFIPERFTPGIERHPFSFIPFAAGPRNCIGQKFAMMELKTTLSTVLRHCRLEPVTTSVTPESVIIIKPIEPIMIKVFPRNDTQIKNL